MNNSKLSHHMTNRGFTGREAFWAFPFSNLYVAVGTGIPRVSIFNTVPVPVYTIPVLGTGLYRTILVAVLYETRGVTITCGILIIKIIKINITVTI